MCDCMNGCVGCRLYVNQSLDVVSSSPVYLSVVTLKNVRHGFSSDKGLGVDLIDSTSRLQKSWTSSNKK